MRRWRLGPDLPVAVVAYVASTVGFMSWYSRRIFDPGAFDGYFAQGIFRYRIVGRELVSQAYQVVGNPLGEHLPRRIVGANPGAMFTALVLVNGLCFLLLCWLLSRLLRRSGPTEPGRTLVYVTVVALIAFSGYVVTPYDQLGYLLLLAVVMAVDARPPLDLAAPALALVAVANRETAFVAVAALLAVEWPLARQANGRFARRTVITVAIGVVTVVGYVALRLVFADSDGGGRLWQEITVLGNIGRLVGWIGAGLMVAMLWWWWSACDVSRFGNSDAARAAVRRLWLIAVPYLLVSALTGYWFEVRLLVPMVLAECWVRARAGARMTT